MRFIKNLLLSHSDSYSNALLRIKDLEECVGNFEIICQDYDRVYQNSDKILAVLERMGDEKSRTAYRNEIVTVLLGVNGLELAQKLGFTVSPEAMEAQLNGINMSDYPHVEYCAEWNFPPQAAGMAFAYPQYVYMKTKSTSLREQFFWIVGRVPVKYLFGPMIKLAMWDRFTHLNPLHVFLSF